MCTAPSKLHKRTLPLEDIELIVEHVSCRHDLFALLIVCKGVGEKAVRELYRDPLRFVSLDDIGLSSLLCMLLSLSPADDNQTRLLRLSIGTPLCSELVPRPTLDYLSLLKVFDWGTYDPKSVQSRLRWYIYNIRRPQVEDDEMLQESSQHPHFLKRTLTFALVGHQLQQIEMLEVEVGDIRRYIDEAAQLSPIIKIRVLGGEPWDRFYAGATSLVLVIQKHHGKDRLRDIVLMPNPLEDGPKSDDTGLVYAPVLEIYSMLPQPRYPLLRPWLSGSMVPMDRPFDRDLVRIVEAFATPWPPTWRVTRHLFRDLARGQLLTLLPL